MRLAIFAGLAVILAAPALAQKPYAGTATGSLTIDGKPIALKFAYVIDVDNVEEAGLQMAGARRSTVIVLSDRPLPRASVANRDAPYSHRLSPAQMLAPVSKTEADKVYGIVLKLEPGKANPLGAQLLIPGSDNVAFTVAGTEYPDRVTGMARANGFLSDTATLASAHATGAEKGPKKYLYRASFRAPVQTEEPVTGILTGDSALQSAPVAALRSYAMAGKKGDVDALQALTAATHVSYLANKEFVETLKSFEVEKIPEQVKRVVVRGNTATVMVVTVQPNYSQTPIHLVREKGDWKLCLP